MHECWLRLLKSDTGNDSQSAPANMFTKDPECTPVFIGFNLVSADGSEFWLDASARIIGAHLADEASYCHGEKCIAKRLWLCARYLCMAKAATFDNLKAITNGP